MKGQYNGQHSGSVRVVVAAAVAMIGGSLVPQATDVAQTRECSPPLAYGATNVAHANAMSVQRPVGVRICQPQSGASARERQTHVMQGGPTNDAHNPSAYDLITALKQQDERGLAEIVGTLASTHSLAGALHMVALKAPYSYGVLDRYCAARGLITHSRSPARVAGSRPSHKPTPDTAVVPQFILDNYPGDHVQWLEELSERVIRDGADDQRAAEAVSDRRLNGFCLVEDTPAGFVHYTRSSLARVVRLGSSVVGGNSEILDMSARLAEIARQVGADRWARLEEFAMSPAEAVQQELTPRLEEFVAHWEGVPA